MDRLDWDAIVSIRHGMSANTHNKVYISIYSNVVFALLHKYDNVVATQWIHARATINECSFSLKSNSRIKI